MLIMGMPCSFLCPKILLDRVFSGGELRIFIIHKHKLTQSLKPNPFQHKSIRSIFVTIANEFFASPIRLLKYYLTIPSFSATAHILFLEITLYITYLTFY